MIAMDNRDGNGKGNKEAKYIWVYIAMPLIGSTLASLFYLFHNYLENSSSTQVKPQPDEVYSLLEVLNDNTSKKSK